MANAAIIGDENGLLKLVDVNNAKYEAFGNQDRSTGVSGLCWENLDNSFWVTRLNGVCELWNVLDSKLLLGSSIELGFTPSGINRSIHSDLRIAYSKSGMFQILKSKTRKHGTSSIEMKHAFDLSNGKTSYDISDCQTCSDGFAIGGNENDLQLVDLETGNVVWKAKNVANDNLSLRVPIWITKLCFLNPTTDSISTGSTILTGTGYKQVRLYDTRLNSKRKPVISMEVGDYRVTSLSVTCSNNPLDSEEGSKNIGNGITAYVGDMHFVPTAPTDSSNNAVINYNTNVLANISLDRFLRIYNIKKNKLVKHVYIKSRASRMLLFSENCSSTVSFVKNESEEEEDSGSGSEGSDEEGSAGSEGEDEVEEYVDSDEEVKEEEEEEGENSDDNEDEDEDDSEEVEGSSESEEEVPAKSKSKKIRK